MALLLLLVCNVNRCNYTLELYIDLARFPRPVPPVPDFSLLAHYGFPSWQVSHECSASNSAWSPRDKSKLYPFEHPLAWIWKHFVSSPLRFKQGLHSRLCSRFRVAQSHYVSVWLSRTGHYSPERSLSRTSPITGIRLWHTLSIKWRLIDRYAGGVACSQREQ